MNGRRILIGGKWSFAAAPLAALLLAGCMVGPKYQRPQAQTPTAWKEQAPFRAATPKDSVSKGDWWTIFNDAQLDQYIAQAMKANQTIESASHQLDAARSSARIQTAGLLPTMNVNPTGYYQRLSGNRPSNGATIRHIPITQSAYTVPFNVGWEPDIFGGLRRGVEAANALYQSSAANLENIRLLIASEVAADYFQLRKGLDLVERRHTGGVASGLDVAQQKTVLDQTLTQAALLVQQRKQYEHAIATLEGVPASQFSIAVNPLKAGPPEIPLGLPSDVLERRPDIAMAERQVAAQNAQIGVAKAALYPTVNLFGQGGNNAQNITTLANAPSFIWSLGAGAMQPIFSGGRLHAQVDYQKSLYGQSVANYRETVLTAFQEVEDGIAGLNVLANAAQTQDAAVTDATNALRIANDRYTGGVVTYLDVITAQETLLTNQRLATQILGQRLVTSVVLVKALGGGWDSSSLQAIGVHPTAKQALQQ
jgi:multidrug efflux system outer membrane protein